MTESDSRHDSSHKAHHHDHREARQEHVDWKEAAGRWREEYWEAVIEYARRTLPELELADYEQTLDRHEAAMEVAISAASRSRMAMVSPPWSR